MLGDVHAQLISPQKRKFWTWNFILVYVVHSPCCCSLQPAVVAHSPLQPQSALHRMTTRRGTEAIPLSMLLTWVSNCSCVWHAKSRTLSCGRLITKCLVCFRVLQKVLVTFIDYFYYLNSLKANYFCILVKYSVMFGWRPILLLNWALFKCEIYVSMQLLLFNDALFFTSLVHRRCMFCNCNELP